MKKTNAKPGKKRLSGGAHLKAAGKTGILVGLTSEQLEAVDRACALEGRSRANFVTHYSVQAAVEIIERASPVK